MGLLPALTVFATVLGLYRLTTRLVAKSERVDRWLEGNPIQLINAGEFEIGNIEKGELGQDEFFCRAASAQCRIFGPGKTGDFENQRQRSVFFFSDDEVKYGLPIPPHAFRDRPAMLDADEPYACTFCDHVETVPVPQARLTCSRCRNQEWAKASKGTRVFKTQQTCSLSSANNSRLCDALLQP